MSDAISGIDWGTGESKAGSAFAREYTCAFAAPSPEEISAIVMWCWYYVSTEMYDRIVCTGPMGRGGILPGNEWERGMIAQHAKARLEDVRRSLCGVDPEIIKRAKREAQALSFELQDQVMRQAGMRPHYMGGSSAALPAHPKMNDGMPTDPSPLSLVEREDRYIPPGC